MLREQFPDVELEGQFILEFMDRQKARSEARGEARGEVHGKAQVLLRLLDRSGVELSQEQRTKIEGCTDKAQMDAWIDRSFDAKSAADLFG